MSPDSGLSQHSSRGTLVALEILISFCDPLQIPKNQTIAF
jgi:hypothetical protein